MTILAALCAPLAAKADTIGGSTFTLPGLSGSIDYVGGGTFTIYLGGSSTEVDCNTINPMNAWIPTDMQVPTGAAWEYWQGEEVANTQDTYVGPGDPYVSGGTHVAWSYLFARSLSTGAAFYWNGSQWISTPGYQPFLHPGGSTYAIHDWVYFGLANGTRTQWADLGFRSSHAYRGVNHLITVPDCVY